MAGLRVHRELLGNRPLIRLLLGAFISGIGDWLYIVAIFVVIYRELGPNEVFGELGLLYQMPRTATVTADTDGRLLALERDDFLALVGVGGPLRGRLLGLYAGSTGTR